MQLFRNTSQTPLKNVALRNCTITDDGMEILLNHNLTSLSMWYCDSVTTKCWQTLTDRSCNLRVLDLGRYVDIVKHRAPNDKQAFDFQLDLPELRKLRLNAIALQADLKFR